MAKRVFLIGLLAAAGCAEVRTVGVNYERSEGLVCGNWLAKPADFQAQAATACTAAAEPLRCGERLDELGGLQRGDPESSCCLFRCGESVVAAPRTSALQR